MRKHLIIAGFALALSPGVSLAQAVVGGTVGTTGDVVVLPPQVRSYVVQEDIPSVVVDQNVAVGEVLPPTVELHVVPRYSKYRFAMINHERVVVDPSTRRVIEIIR